MPNARRIPGTTIFNGAEAQKGLALNKMCFSFNNAENRAEFLRDPDAYCAKFGLTSEQTAAVKDRNVLAMIEAGGNVYYLAKLAGIFGLNVQDIGAQQTGMTRRSLQDEAASSGEIAMASDHRRHRDDARSGDRQRDRQEACRTIHTGNPFFDGFKAAHAWLNANQAGRRSS